MLLDQEDSKVTRKRKKLYNSNISKKQHIHSNALASSLSLSEVNRFGLHLNEFYQIGHYRGNLTSFCTLAIDQLLDDAVLCAIASHLIQESNVLNVQLLDCFIMDAPNGFRNMFSDDALSSFRFYVMLNPGRK